MNCGDRHALAEYGSPDTIKGDDALFCALLHGCHVESAAASAGVSQRTAYRRLADPIFQTRLEEGRQELREAILAKLADAGDAAVSTLWQIMESSEDERARVQSAKIILDSFLSHHAKTPRTETTTKVLVESSRKQRDLPIFCESRTQNDPHCIAQKPKSSLGNPGNTKD